MEPLSRRGLTLPEVLMAVLVVSIPILALLSVLLAISGGVRSSREHIQAVSLARMKLDEKVAQGRADFTSLVSGPLTPTAVDAGNFPGFTYTFTVTGSYLGNPDVKELRVTIFWQESRNGLVTDHRYPLATLLAR